MHLPPASCAPLNAAVEPQAILAAFRYGCGALETRAVITVRRRLHKFQQSYAQRLRARKRNVLRDEKSLKGSRLN